jgi:hypothetical protein
MDSCCELGIRIDSSDQTPAEFEEDSRYLREILRDASFDVRSSSTVAPAGAMSGDVFSLGTVGLTILTAALPKLISILREYVNAREKRKLELKFPDGTTVKMTGPVSTAQAEQLIARFRELDRARIDGAS